jgi:hypothetical protein
MVAPPLRATKLQPLPSTSPIRTQKPKTAFSISRYLKQKPNPFNPNQTKPNTTPHPALHIAIMTRGEAQQTKVHYKGKDEDFVIFVDDVKSAKGWKTDKTIPLAQVVSAFKIFVTHK